MAKALPYLATPGSLRTALDKIQNAATPEKVSGDFISNKLQIKGGTGTALSPYLKRVGLVAPDSSPTELYKRFRNPSSSKSAIADAIRIGYAPLSEINEKFYDLNDAELRGLIVQAIGSGADDQVTKLILTTYKILRSYASFTDVPAGKAEILDAVEQPSTLSYQLPIHVPQASGGKGVGLNLSYTINLNLPATNDQSVFNAIFKSLRENLLGEE